MQFDTVSVQAQPFIKLAQSNMELLTRFASAPEVMTQATAGASQLFQQATTSAQKLMNSGAFAHLMQGMLSNYIEFLGEVSQGSMTALMAGQAAFTRQAQEATDTVIDEAQVRGRRGRQAA